MLIREAKTLCACALIAGLLPAVAGAGADKIVKAKLSGYNEVPSISSAASGRFTAKIDTATGTIAYEMTYNGLEGSALQSHIHIGQTHVSGGISAFLCTNLNNAPSAAVPACPVTSGTVSGTIQASDVVGPNAQGIAPGEFAELVAAIRTGAAYVNVHTSKVPSGEIRGQIKSSDD